ncbi:uncharacterized protein LOC103963690 [Pyrus x bretschneideri]|uniref:uncharacterized protein LOC103963690 n=1 Tax=Pyrus x bretschneideri TaxID=225117 RepID=UPI00202F885F|nr:uncharacterized protein LOC103963690 [Pyrus x bretschneideri]
MGQRVRESISGPEVVPNITSITIQAGSSRELIHLSGSIKSSSELYSHMRRAGGPTALWKLRPYFQGQLVIVMTQYPLQSVLHNPDGSQQGNGQVEASNKTILDCLKKFFSDKNDKWLDEFPNFLWAYRTIKRRATGETPFSIVYGSEAIIPPNVMVPSISIVLLNLEQDENEMATNLGLVEEEREKVITRIIAYQQQLLFSYNKRAKTP